jgi:hypothetical protein
MAPLRFLPLVLCSFLGAAACGGDEDELVISVLSPMAVEATVDGRLSDPCYGNKAGASCDPDEVVSVSSITADTPALVDLMPFENQGNPRDRFHFYVVAKQAGQTTIRARASFDDGTVRDAQVPLRIVSIDEIRVGFDCLRREGAPVNAPHLVQQGLSMGVAAAPYGRGEHLEGSIDQLVEAEGLENGTFVAPLRDGVFPIRSRFLGDLGVALESFGPDRITAIVAEWYGEAPVIRQGRPFHTDLYLRIGDAIPCHAGPGSLNTGTPAICTGPVGETTWTTKTLDRIFTTAVSAGTCQLTISPTGGSRTYDVSFEVAFE